MNALLARIPHEGPMLFIDDVVSVEGRRATTRTTIGDDHVMLQEGTVSSLIAVELFAQTAAVLMAQRSGSGQRAPGVTGALLGTRAIDVSVPSFRPGDELTTTVEEKWGTGQIAQFDCVLHHGDDEVARGSINVAGGTLPE